MAPWGIVVREIGQFLPNLNEINQSENVERLNVSIEFSTRTGTIAFSTILLKRIFREQFDFMKSNNFRLYLTAKWKSVFDVRKFLFLILNLICGVSQICL